MFDRQYIWITSELIPKRVGAAPRYRSIVNGVITFVLEPRDITLALELVFNRR